jgi:hypothetical protein
LDQSGSIEAKRSARIRFVAGPGFPATTSFLARDRTARPLSERDQNVGTPVVGGTNPCEQIAAFKIVEHRHRRRR